MISRIIPEAETIVRAAGMSDNQDKLLKIGAAPPEQQVAVAQAMAQSPPAVTDFGAKGKWLDAMAALWRRGHPNWQAEFLRSNPFFPEEKAPPLVPVMQPVGKMAE